MRTRVFRDYHGHGLRGALMPDGVPRHRSRSRLFDAAVLEAYAPIQADYPEQLAGLDIAVDVIPRMRLNPDLDSVPTGIVADGSVPLGRLITAGVDTAGNPTRARLVIFRMPVEQRTHTTEERHELLSTVLTALVAEYLGIAPQDIDSRFEW